MLVWCVGESSGFGHRIVHRCSGGFGRIWTVAVEITKRNSKNIEELPSGNGGFSHGRVSFERQARTAGGNVPAPKVTRRPTLPKDTPLSHIASLPHPPL